MNRRDFFRRTAIGGLGLPLVGFSGGGSEPGKEKPQLFTKSLPPFESSRKIDLSPAIWIWYPSARTLSNTVVLFRKEFTISSPVKKARGWIVADSRYRLFVNGKRIQWGPPPSDPRWMEVDPVDLTGELHEGVNIIGIEVLFYGHGDGTWPVGKPGLLFNVEVEGTDGGTTRILSDESWKAHLAAIGDATHSRGVRATRDTSRRPARLTLLDSGSYQPASWSALAGDIRSTRLVGRFVTHL